MGAGLETAERRLSKNQRRINTILQRIPGTQQLIIAMRNAFMSKC
jgi:hypothetical protein